MLSGDRLIWIWFQGRTAILAVILDVAISAEAVTTSQLALQGEAHGGAVGVMGAG